MRVDLAHGAGVLKIDSVMYTDRLRGQEIARHGVDGGSAMGEFGNAERQQCVDLDAEQADGFLDAFERDRVGNAQSFKRSESARCGA